MEKQKRRPWSVEQVYTVYSVYATAVFALSSSCQGKVFIFGWNIGVYFLQLFPDKCERRDAFMHANMGLRVPATQEYNFQAGIKGFKYEYVANAD